MFVHSMTRDEEEDEEFRAQQEQQEEEEEEDVTGVKCRRWSRRRK